MEFESAVATSTQIELLQAAIHHLLQSKRSTPSNSHHDDDDHDDDDDDSQDRHLLSKLLSQLESLKVDGVAKPSEPSAAEIEPLAREKGGPGAEDVVKELKKLERQNRVTHWLLSALILLTAAWQLSEVSLLLKLKHGLTHPFKSFGSFVTGIFKCREEEKQLTPMQIGTENRLKFAKDVQSLITNDDQQ